MNSRQRRRRLPANKRGYTVNSAILWNIGLADVSWNIIENIKVYRQKDSAELLKSAMYKILSLISRLSNSPALGWWVEPARPTAAANNRRARRYRGMMCAHTRAFFFIIIFNPFVTLLEAEAPRATRWCEAFQPKCQVLSWKQKYLVISVRLEDIM